MNSKQHAASGEHQRVKHYGEDRVSIIALELARFSVHQRSSDWIRLRRLVPPASIRMKCGRRPISHVRLFVSTTLLRQACLHGPPIQIEPSRRFLNCPRLGKHDARVTSHQLLRG
jgi:hypothetical protein